MSSKQQSAETWMWETCFHSFWEKYVKTFVDECSECSLWNQQNLNIVTLEGIPPFDLLLLKLNTPITSSNALAKVKSSTTFCVSSVLWQRHQTDRLPRVAVPDQPTASAAGGSYVPTLYDTRVSAVSSFWRTTAGDLRSLHREGPRLALHTHEEESRPQLPTTPQGTGQVIPPREEITVRSRSC